MESSAAAERNKEPIAQAVRQHLAGAAEGVLVEVACGYGRAWGGSCGTARTTTSTALRRRG